MKDAKKLTLTKVLWLVRRPELATHIQLDLPSNERAICGAYIGPYPSWSETTVFRGGHYMNPHGLWAKDPLGYTDCLRCAAIYRKAVAPDAAPSSVGSPVKQ